MDQNFDKKVVSDFGDEWQKFNYREKTEELSKIFDDYFHIFPFDKLSESSEGFDMGCGTGRWARFVASKIGKLNCIDPSEKAINEAKINLKFYKNCTFECCAIEDSRIKNDSQDFGYSLGVLHHIPDTEGALLSSVNKLKQNAPFLAYFYYSFDNKPYWYGAIWKISDYMRKLISNSPFIVKYFLSQLVAMTIYFPLAKISKFIKFLKFNTSNIPLNYYCDKSFYVMRTDALDRLGTKLEKRFSKKEIYEMFVKVGLKDIKFSDKMPFWCVLGYKK